MKYYHKRKEEIKIKLKEINKNKGSIKEKNHKILKIKEMNRKFLFEKYSKKIIHIQFTFKIYFLIFKSILISFMNFPIIFVENELKRFLFKSYEVTLKIKGSGNINILSDNFFNKYNPNRIYINNTISLIKNEHNFNNSENTINIVKINFNIGKIDTTESMFYNCSKIIEINLSKFDTSESTSMASMFSKCSSLISLNLSNFNTSKVGMMDNMFSGCSSLRSLDLSNFKTSKVFLMSSMFSGCSSLNSLDLSNFNTSSVSVMAGIFSKCSSLISIDLSNFDTSNVNVMDGMFSGCSSLSSLDLSKFNTSKVGIMGNVFSGCSSLISLDLSNFDTSKTTIMRSMFSQCENLKYINLKRVNTSSNALIDNIFFSTSNQLVVCIDNDNDILIKLLDGKVIIYCNNNISYHENMNKCYLKNSTIYNKYICDICGENFTIKYDISTINVTYIECFEQIEGYYLDENNKKYKSCYNSCKTCELKGNEEINNCIECKNDFSYEFNLINSNYKNCYINNPFQVLNENEKSPGMMKSIINNLINKFNIIQLNDGKDKKIITKNNIFKSYISYINIYS